MKEPMQNKRQALRRALLTGVIAAIFAPAALAQTPPNPYSRGVWLAGDHHMHTHHSDGSDTVEDQVRYSVQHGLDWCVITDHGGKNHDKIALEKVYPELLAARKKHPNILVFQGLEWNVPSGDHASVILPMGPDEAKRIAEFEALFDARNESRPERSKQTEADAFAGIRHLESLTPLPLFFLNHPMRGGRYSPSELRGYADAGPRVTRGFEGAPGHQAALLGGGKIPRGAYNGAPSASSFPGYPAEGYRTWGGYDWFTATVGGVWDSLLGEGRNWFITATSDAHGRYREGKGGADFYPGEYSKTWVYADRRAPQAVLEGMRAGNMFTVMGDLIDRCELSVSAAGKAAPMGGVLDLPRAGEEVTMTLRVRVPRKPNHRGERPEVHHIDVVTGDIVGAFRSPHTQTNPTTRVAARLRPEQAIRNGEWMVFTYRFPHVTESFYVRVRGTNQAVEAPQMDAKDTNPWHDLWFYSNPVRVRVGG